MDTVISHNRLANLGLIRLKKRALVIFKPKPA
jgi:hypothetical protein